MAQLETSTSQRKTGRRFLQRRKTIFVDLTPMVDLAFLLITFFMLTVSMTEQQAMPLVMPAKSDEPAHIAPGRMLTVIAAKENTLWYYNGGETDDMKQTNYSDDGLRNLLYENKRRVHEQFASELVCIVKLTDDANYQNMVSVLDEMDITNVKCYAIQDITGEEQEIIDTRSIKIK